MQKWLFFDLGSTLIDESACEEFRFQKLLEQPGAPDRGVLQQTMIALAAENRLPYKDAARMYGLTTVKWPTELERLYAQAPAILEELSKRYRLGVIANQNPGTEDRLRNFGIRQYFVVIAASAELGIAKPDHRIFQCALDQAGCHPEDAVMIGDRLDNDIHPAAALGIQTVWIQQGPFRYADPKALNLNPTHTITKLSELLTIL